jgi:hypothetical protein
MEIKMKIEFKKVNEEQTKIYVNGGLVGEIIKERKCVNRRMITFKKLYFKGKFIGMHSTQADTKCWIKDALSKGN